MSDLDFINFLMINDTDRGGKNTERRMDLDERRKLLERFGEVKTLTEFKMDHPADQPHTWRNLGIGAVIGTVAGAVLGGVLTLGIPAGMISGAIAGGAIGAFTDTQNTRRGNLLDEYEHYLDQVEASRRVPARAPSPIVTRTDHLERELGRPEALIGLNR